MEMTLFLMFMSMFSGICFFVLFFLATAWRRDRRGKDFVQPYKVAILTLMIFFNAILTEVLWVTRFRTGVDIDMAQVPALCFIMMAVGFIVSFIVICWFDSEFRYYHLPRFIWERFQKRGMSLEEQSRLYAQRSQQQTE